MAIEQPPSPEFGNQKDLMRYTPPENLIAKLYFVKPGYEETIESVAMENNVTPKDLLDFNFPGSVVDGKVDKAVTNWYLNHHINFHCPDTHDGQNRRFRGGETLAIPHKIVSQGLSEATVVKSFVGRGGKTEGWMAELIPVKGRQNTVETKADEEAFNEATQDLDNQIEEYRKSLLVIYQSHRVVMAELFRTTSWPLSKMGHHGEWSRGRDHSEGSGGRPITLPTYYYNVICKITANVRYRILAWPRSAMGIRGLVEPM